MWLHQRKLREYRKVIAMLIEDLKKELRAKEEGKEKRE